MGTQGTGRKRSTKKDRSTAEDDALNLIAREAEARLAAKRAARAEAREIRMKELERQQKELSDEDERMSVGSRGSVRVEDRDYLEKGSRAASALTAATLTSLGGSSSRRGSGETALTVDAESSLREIKEIHELKDQIQDVESKYSQNLKEVKDALAQSEEKYRKAMVSNAQLDNEKNNLMYQVDTLKDSLMELEELLSESRREYEEKAKDYEREKHAHGVLQFQFNEMKETLKQSEELLNKHGIVLGPDLNINGDVGEAESEGTPATNPAGQPAQEPLSSPTEGNSMLGNTEETEFRSSRKDDVDPEQQKEILEESKENLLNSGVRCDGADESTLETSEEKHLPETDSPIEEGSVGEDGIHKDLIIEPVAESKAVTVSSSEHPDNVTNPEESLPELAVSEERGLNETRYPDSEETEIKSSAETHESDFIERSNNLSEEQDKELEDTEGTGLISTEASQQQTAACVMKEGPVDESFTELLNTEPQQEVKNAEEAENDAAEETPSNSNKGKKKKKKKKGKKKGVTQNNSQNQQSSGTEKESDKTVKQVESGEVSNESIVEPHADTSVSENFKESNENPAENEQETQQDGSTAQESNSQEKCLEETQPECEKEEKQEEIKTLEEVEAAQPPETLIDTGDHSVSDEQKKEQTEETPIIESVEAVVLSDVETHNELRTDSRENEKEDELSWEGDKLQAVDPEASPGGSNINSNSGDSLSKEGTGLDSTDNADPVPTSTSLIDADSNTVDELKDESEAVEETTTECTNNSLETGSDENGKLESLVSNGSDVSAPESESLHVSSPPTTDAFMSLSESELSDATKSDIDPSINVFEQSPEEGTEAVTNSEAPGAEAEEESAASPSQDSELEPEETEMEELDQDVTEAGVSDETHSSSFEEKSESSHSAPVINQLTAADTETAVQNEQLEESEGKIPQHIDQTEETVPEEKREEDHSLDSQEEASRTEIGTSMEQETADGEDENSQHDESEALPESVQTKSENMDSSPPTQLDSDEEDEEDEGQSFDFDDLDVEAAVAPDVSHNPEEEEFEEGVEATSDESSDGRSGLCQSDAQSDGRTRDEPAATNEETPTVDRLNQADSKAQEKQNPLAHGESPPEKEESVPKEGEPGGPEGEKGDLGAVVENIKQKMSSLVEEALDVVKLDWQNEAPAPLGSTDQVTESKEPAQQAGRGARKGKGKGKGKGKEDCKVA
uniref:Leucine rich repeat (in FLII) interacting protein 1a n=1 Tax=Salarias fasciatus TaxID=181472 RepID=A0A672FBV7_SALFA